ncbi:MAG: sodium-dependent transporter [Lachnospiraceae bacterium]|nr:sodium-dependent transporter [Lachnospiraceae bacterium]
MDNNRGFASRLGFIMSMAAFSIGVGNIWKFPYVVGNSGGGAFLIVYLAMVILVGYPTFLIEVGLGRSSGFSPIRGMQQLEKSKKTPWTMIGWLGALSVFIIVGYATMIVGGWTGGYIFKTISGSLQGLDADGISTAFSQYSGSNASLLFTLATYVLMWLCLNSGVKKGVEKVCSVLLPILFVIMIGLAIYSCVMPGGKEGLLWYIKPDFSKIDASVISAAATQVFFSIGIGMCCAFVYGSYISKDTNMTGSLALTALLDTTIAVLAGLICVPALFSFGIEPTTGPSLIFVTLPQLFNAMGSFGRIFGCLFMLCVYFAGFTSVLGGAESLVAILGDNTKRKRSQNCTIVVIALFILSIFFTRSFGTGFLSKIRILGMGLFDFGDFIASGICLTLGAILMLAYVLFRWGFDKFKEEINAGATGKIRIYDWMKPYFCIVLPIILIAVCYCIVRMYI